LNHLLILAREVAEAECEVVPEPEIDKGKAALTELFNGIKNEKTPIIVERIVADIDGIVKIVRFPGWQNTTTTGRQEVKKLCAASCKLSTKSRTLTYSTRRTGTLRCIIDERRCKCTEMR
jgi:hypothetical protein